MRYAAIILTMAIIVNVIVARKNMVIKIFFIRHCWVKVHFGVKQEKILFLPIAL